MPEQLTKHPEVTLQVLRSAGAKCDEGARQDILTQCPAQSFCKLPGGELCVYGLPEASKMTQITSDEWRAIVQSLPAAPAKPAGSANSEMLLGGVGGLIAGAVIAAAVSHLRRRS